VVIAIIGILAGLLIPAISAARNAYYGKQEVHPVVAPVDRSPDTSPPVVPLATPNPNLISCPDCNQTVSKLAKVCPHCGRPQNTVEKLEGVETER